MLVTAQLRAAVCSGGVHGVVGAKDGGAKAYKDQAPTRTSMAVRCSKLSLTSPNAKPYSRRPRELPHCAPPQGR